MERASGLHDLSDDRKACDRSGCEARRPLGEIDRIEVLRDGMRRRGKLDALLEVAGESVQAANQAAVLLERLSQFKFEGQAATLMAISDQIRLMKKMIMPTAMIS